MYLIEFLTLGVAHLKRINLKLIFLCRRHTPNMLLVLLLDWTHFCRSYMFHFIASPRPAPALLISRIAVIFSLQVRSMHFAIINVDRKFTSFLASLSKAHHPPIDGHWRDFMDRAHSMSVAAIVVAWANIHLPWSSNSWLVRVHHWSEILSSCGIMVMIGHGSWFMNPSSSSWGSVRSYDGRLSYITRGGLHRLMEITSGLSRVHCNPIGTMTAPTPDRAFQRRIRSSNDRCLSLVSAHHRRDGTHASSGSWWMMWSCVSSKDSCRVRIAWSYGTINFLFQ